MSVCKMHKVQPELEYQCISEGSKVRVYMSAVRICGKERRKEFIKTAAITFAQVVYSLLTSFFLGMAAIDFAYLERGYHAVGSEYMVFPIVFWIAFSAIGYCVKQLEK